MPLPSSSFCLALQEHAHAEGFHLAGEIGSAGGIELAFHQHGRKVDDADFATANPEAAGGFETKETTADDDGFFARPIYQGGLEGTVESTENGDVFLLHAGDRRDEGAAAHCENELVVGRAVAFLVDHHVGFAVDVGDANAELLGADPVRLIPINVVQHDLIGGLFAGENHGQHDAVVVDVASRHQIW